MRRVLPSPLPFFTWSRAAALVLVVAIYGFARLPAPSPDSVERAQARFAWSEQELPVLGVGQLAHGENGTESLRRTRVVHPSLERIEGWISSVGASAALADFDGDGLPNEICLVDPRNDAVGILPVPSSTQRFAPIVFDLWTSGDEKYETVAPMGCLPGDYNEDGWVDALIYYWGRPPQIWLRRAVGSLGGAGENPVAAFEAIDVLPHAERWYTNAATRADIDGDGHIDLILGNYFADGAHILDAKAGGREEMQSSMSRALNGGRDRLLLWRGTGETSSASGEPSGFHFEDLEGVLEDEIAGGWSLAAAAADLDGDLLPEIYLAHDFGPDRLLHNRSRPGHVELVAVEGRRGFATAASKVLGHDSFKGMGAEFGDLDGDGRLDLFVSNIAQEYALEESHFMFMNTGEAGALAKGIAPFVDRSEQLGLSRSGWAWDARLADFDNDGQLEIVQATGFVRGVINRWPELHEVAMANDQLLHDPRSWPRVRLGDDLSGHQANAFFVRTGERYSNLAGQVGLGRGQVTRGIATGDVDGDGDLDMVFANQWDASRFYRNESPSAGSFLGLRLLVPLEPRAETLIMPGRPPVPSSGPWGSPAIGATVTARLAERPGARALIAQVDGGNGHSGARSPEVHFGLGDESGSSVEVEIAWRDPSGTVHRDRFVLEPGWHTVVLAWPLPGKEV